MHLSTLLLAGSLLAVSPDDSLRVASELGAPLVSALRERRHEDAERIATRQLDLRRRFGRARDLDLATSLTYLSLATRNLGDVTVSESSAREALEIMLELYGRASSNSATAMNNLAGALRLKGDLVSAEALSRESLQLQTQQFGEAAPQLSGAHNNLGALLGQLGDGVGSEEHLRRAVELARQHYGDEHPNVALALVNLANALRGQGRALDALAELDRAQALYQTLGDSVGWSDAGRTRVRTLLDLEDDAALAAAEALSEFQRSLPNGSALAMARVEALRGRALLQASRPVEASELLQTTRAALERRLGPSHPETVNVSRDLALALLDSGSNAALPLLEGVAESYEAARGRLALSRNRATADLSSPYEALARARLRAGNEVGAWRASEKQQGRVLEELLDLSAATLPSEILRRRSALLDELSDVEQTLARFDESPDVDASLRGERYAELLRLQAEWSRLQEEIVALRPERRGAPTVEEVTRALPADGALIGWISGAAYCIRSDVGLRWVHTHPVEAELREELQRDLRAPGDAPAFIIPQLDEAARSRMHSLYDGFVRELEPLLEGVEDLFAVSGVGLRGIPLDVLLDGSGRSLGDRFRIRMLPSAAFLLRQDSKAPKAERAFFVGSPPFAGGSSRRYTALAPLANSLGEIERCAASFAHAERLVGAQATESALRDLLQRDQLRQFDVLHIATHALADARQPGRSVLVLSQESLGDPVDAVLAGRPVLDGAVSAEEIARSWKLDAELVTLSACESGLGRHTEGEGYLGFAHSLFEAGARRLLVSLWPVDDEATALLMERFYGNWIRVEMEPARALQQAKWWLRDFDGGRFEHPYYWAAFVLLGA